MMQHSLIDTTISLFYQIGEVLTAGGNSSDACMQLLRCVYMKLQYLRRGWLLSWKTRYVCTRNSVSKSSLDGHSSRKQIAPSSQSTLRIKDSGFFKCCFFCSGCGKNAAIISLFTFATHDTGPSNRERAPSARRTSAQRAITPRHDDMSPS